jgi:hypothetical protein
MMTAGAAAVCGTMPLVGYQNTFPKGVGYSCRSPGPMVRFSFVGALALMRVGRPVWRAVAPSTVHCFPASLSCPPHID